MPALPHRADCVDDMLRGQAVAAGDLGVTGVATIEGAALGQKLGAGRTMYRAIDTAAAEQRGVGGVDDGVNVERDDIGLAGLAVVRACSTHPRNAASRSSTSSVSCSSAWRRAAPRVSSRDSGAACPAHIDT